MKHFTATTFIVQDRKVLLLKHKKFGKWLPPGGHIEQDEEPVEAALREVREETGMDVELVDTHASKAFYDDSGAHAMLTPWRMLLEDIEPNHWHMDFLFVARVKSEAHSAEQHEMKWFSAADLDSEKEIFANVRFYGKKAIEALSLP